MADPNATPVSATLQEPADLRPQTLHELLASGWKTKTVKQEIRDNLLALLKTGDDLFPGIIGYDDTVIPEIVIGLLAGHDLLFLGEKGQAKSRLMRRLVAFLDDAIPYIDDPRCPVHEDPLKPISRIGKEIIATEKPEAVPIQWWSREERYAERLSPGTKFADIIGEIDPMKLVQGTSMGAEEALHFGLIPRMHRGIFAMNEVPELDEAVQVGLFNILEERDVQIRGYPIRFDLDLMVLFSANPATYNRSGKVIPQLKDRIGSIIQTHYPLERSHAMAITRQEADLDEATRAAVFVPTFMQEIVEEISLRARNSSYIDQASGVSARMSIANYRTMVASARRRGIAFNEMPATARISDLSHFYSACLGKMEMDLMGSQQLTERQMLTAIQAEAIRTVFESVIGDHVLGEIAEIFAKGVRIEVGDMLPSSQYAERLQNVPPLWDKVFEMTPSENESMRASVMEFVLAGLYASEKISRSEHAGRIRYEI